MKLAESTDHITRSTPHFFLYTALNQNDTKQLKKSATNTEERRMLAAIFGLRSLESGKRPSKVELLLLDFHSINYEFCKRM
jgi:hypothetical protein